MKEDINKSTRLLKTTRTRRSNRSVRWSTQSLSDTLKKWFKASLSVSPSLAKKTASTLYPTSSLTVLMCSKTWTFTSHGKQQLLPSQLPNSRVPPQTCTPTATPTNSTTSSLLSLTSPKPRQNLLIPTADSVPELSVFSSTLFGEKSTAWKQDSATTTSSSQENASVRSCHPCSTPSFEQSRHISNLSN